jgi:4-diphosphocytidyl-2-C-methyl-D-erythritol kinase
MEDLVPLGAQLGSDVPFFLLGGTAVGLGRGEELYPLPDGPAGAALVVAPDVHVSTAEAYRALGRPPGEIAAAPWQNVIGRFQSAVWRSFAARSRSGPALFGENDFEPAVFLAHPLLASLKRRLKRAGAESALLSGSGAALFGLFAGRREAEHAQDRLSGQRTFLVSLVSRARYHAMWWRRLSPHVAGKVWPPQSRFA